MFGVTPAVLIILLRPYGFEVTARCLVDWRQRGFLPQLARTSRGYRGGVLRYWAEDNILQCALEVCRRLRGKERKRKFGNTYRNWLGGAQIPGTRAQESWVREFDRRSRTSKYFLRKCGTEFSTSLSLKPCDARDRVEELMCILKRPNYAPGKSLDVLLLRPLLRNLGDALGVPKMQAPMDDYVLVQCLTWVNAVFSPAGYRSLVASATPAELCQARDRYWQWWAKAAGVHHGSDFPETGSSFIQTSIRSLAGVLAPIIVPLLLPARDAEARLAHLEAI